MKLKIKAWHLWTFLIVSLIVWIRWSDYKEETSNKAYKEITKKLSASISLDAACDLWSEAYSFATDNDKKRECLGQLILCYEQKGDFLKAIQKLDEYEDLFETSTASTIHRALLYAKKGNKTKAKSILDSISSSAFQFDEPSFFTKCEDFIFLGNHQDYYDKAYLTYFHEYICRLIAITYRAGLESDSIKRLKCLNQFEHLASIDQRIKEYRDIKIANHRVPNFLILNPLNTLQQNHLYLFQSHWFTTESTIEDILRLKWAFIQMYLDEYDRCYGYQKTKSHFANILKDNKVASDGYQKFLVDAYMAANSPNSKFKLSYNEYKKLNRSGMGWLVRLNPTILGGTSSAFINKGVTKPCILISCNEWQIGDSTPFTRETVLKDKGKVKKVVILKNDFTTDTLFIKENLLGVQIGNRLVNTMTIDLIRHSFPEK